MHRNVQGTIETTLLDLVKVLSTTARTEAEVVATVRHLLATRRIRLTGTFRDRLLVEGREPDWASE